jgi:hypothetical protein
MEAIRYILACGLDVVDPRNPPEASAHIKHHWINADRSGNSVIYICTQCRKMEISLDGEPSF